MWDNNITMEKINWDKIGGRRAQQDITIIGSVFIKWAEWITFFLHIAALVLSIVSLIGIMFIENEAANIIIELITALFLAALVINHAGTTIYNKHTIRRNAYSEWMNEEQDVVIDMHCDLEFGDLVFTPGPIYGVTVKSEQYWLTKNHILDLKLLVFSTTLNLGRDGHELSFHLCPELIVQNNKNKTIEFRGRMIFEDESITTKIQLNYKLYYEEQRLEIMSITPGQEFNIIKDGNNQ